jgi:hypothetical protein
MHIKLLNDQLTNRCIVCVFETDTAHDELLLTRLQKALCNNKSITLLIEDEPLFSFNADSSKLPNQ